MRADVPPPVWPAGVVVATKPALDGGAVAAGAGVDVTLIGGMIDHTGLAGDSADYGGGMRVMDATTTFNVDGMTIRGARAKYYGGGAAEAEDDGPAAKKRKVEDGDDEYDEF